VPARAATTSTGSARAGTHGSSRARSAADRLAAGGRALERDSGLAPQVVERGLEQHQDLDDGVERERLERGGELAELGDRLGAAGGVVMALPGWNWRGGESVPRRLWRVVRRT
jgi:hypothetical protein